MCREAATQSWGELSRLQEVFGFLMAGILVAIPVPVILVRVTVQPRKVLWLNVRQHLLFTDRLKTLYTTSNKTVSFNFAEALELPESVDKLRELAITHQANVAAILAEEEENIRGDFIGYHVLVYLFNSDPDKWLKWLREKGSDIQLLKDVPFIMWLKGELEKDPSFMDHIHHAVENSDEVWPSAKPSKEA